MKIGSAVRRWALIRRDARASINLNYSEARDLAYACAQREMTMPPAI